MRLPQRTRLKDDILSDSGIASAYTRSHPSSVIYGAQSQGSDPVRGQVFKVDDEPDPNLAASPTIGSLQYTEQLPSKETEDAILRPEPGTGQITEVSEPNSLENQSEVRQSNSRATSPRQVGVRRPSLGPYRAAVIGDPQTAVTDLSLRRGSEPLEKMERSDTGPQQNFEQYSVASVPETSKWTLHAKFQRWYLDFHDAKNGKSEACTERLGC
jgi:hypothetical protein